MSPRAASRLETLGFDPVYDYVEGKAAWGSAGLPLEGRNGSETRAGAHTRTDVPTCGSDESLQIVRQRVRAAGWDTCFVTDDERVVLGRLGRAALSREDDVPVEQVMSEGPSTVRPSGRLDVLAERMRVQRLSNLPVTTLEGKLVGVLFHQDADAALEQFHARPPQNG
jgi:Mg/Co/Ni transporter MgtE